MFPFRKVLIILAFWLNEKCINFTLMKQKKPLKGAEHFGVKVVLNKELDKLSKKVLFPEKLEQANKILSNMKFINVK